MAMSGYSCLLRRSINSVTLQVTRLKHYGPPGSYVHGNPLNVPRTASKKFKSKHYSPLFKRERALKTARIHKIPNFQETKKDKLTMTPAEIRTELKEQGILPEAPWKERNFYVASSPVCFEEYVPPEGDGKAAFLSLEGAQQKMDLVTKKGKSMMSTRKIKSYDDEFKLSAFPEEAKEIYIKMHDALCKNKRDLLHKYCTEKLYPTVVQHMKLKTVRWSLVRDLEPTRVVHCRHINLVEDDNYFAQITVRFHNQQTLAVYDRFGRPLHGSEIVARDCLEYIVFEKNISNVYGTWRVHHKIVPPWMNLKSSSAMTYKVQPEPPSEPDETEPEEESTDIPPNTELATA